MSIDNSGFESLNWGQKIVPKEVGPFFKQLKTWVGQNHWKKKRMPLAWLRAWILFCCGLGTCTKTSTLCRTWAIGNTLDLPLFWFLAIPFRLGWHNSYIAFLTCWLWILGCICFHNHMGQFLMLNISYPLTVDV